MIELQKKVDFSYKELACKIEKFANENEFVEFYQQFLDRYKALDAKFSFTESIDEDYIFNQVKHQYQNSASSLRCMPFGIKDIFNTKVLPTSMGSDIWKGFKAGNNARVVDEIYEQGGIIFSKTTTAEFAVHFISPQKTLNPYNVDHITGTSSSGSAVSVACGALPIAIGTQTAGSIIRPASFCGVYGFKPSFGAIDRTGVLKTNDTLDTIGFLGSDIYGIKKTFKNIFLKGKDYPFSINYFKMFESYKKKDKKDLIIGFLGDDVKVLHGFEDYVKNDFSKVIEGLSREFKVVKTENCGMLNEIHGLHEEIYSKSLSYYFTTEMQHYDQVSEVMRDMIAKGEKVSTQAYISAVEKQPVLRNQFNRIFENYDFIIVPSTASYAPELTSTETDDTCLIWTFLGYPTLSIPLFIDKEKNLPYGLQIIAKKFDDFSLLDFGEIVESFFS